MKKLFCLGSIIIFSLLLIGSAKAGYYGSGTYIATRATGFETAVSTKFASSNMTVAREEFLYNSGHNFSSNDYGVKLLYQSGVEVLGLLNYIEKERPSPGDWASYAAAAAERYDGDGLSDAPDHQIINAWEIGNEENDKEISGADYKNYLMAIYNAIKSANPNAKVITGATSGVDVNWLDSLASAGGMSYCDAIGIHPYRINNISPETNWWNIDDFTGHLLQAESFVRRNGGKDIWITEYGWNTSSSGVSQEAQANYLMRAGIMAREIPEVKKIVTYEFRDNSLSDPAESRFGMLNRDFSEKPAYQAMKTLATFLNSKNYSERIYLPNSNNGILDDFDGGLFDWAIDSLNADASITASSAGSAYRGNHAFQFYYKFNTGGNDFLYFKKRIPISGNPKGMGLWVSGPNARNIWALRFTDATGEMFQGNIGYSSPSGWHYFHWDFANMNMTSHWGGNNDGVINYPITFEGVVYDDEPDSSTGSGTAFFDDVTINYGDYDVYFYRFEDTYALWKSSGSTNINYPVSGASATKYDRAGNSTVIATSSGNLNVSAAESPILIKPNTYSSAWVNQNSNPTLNAGDSYQFETNIKNTGSATWTKDVVKLGTSNPLDRVSQFIRGAGWLSPNRVEMVQDSVGPDETATFRFNYTVPINVSAGKYREYFRPLAEGITWMNDQGISWDITVNPPFTSAWQSQNGYPTLGQGQSYQFELIIKNTGSATWTKDVVKLGTSNPLDRIPVFTRGAGWLSANRVEMVESSVDPGANATFRFNYTVPSGLSPGTYKEYFRLVAEGISWLEDQGIFWDVIVVPAYKSTWISQSGNTTLGRGQSQQFEVIFRNDGASTWTKDVVKLGTSNPLDRIPQFMRGTGWLSTNRVEMVESSVAPGANATFRFNYTVPMGLSPGLYKEYFRPVAEGITWMNDQGVHWPINVLGDENDYKTTIDSQSPYPTLSPGESTDLFIKIRNIGQATWQKGIVNLGTSNPLDRTPIFDRGSGWITNNRITLEEDTVAPGNVGTFRFNYSVPIGTPLKAYDEYFRPVVDGLKWLEDQGIFLRITVQ